MVLDFTHQKIKLLEFSWYNGLNWEVIVINVRLVVFDLDGTLVASLEGIAYSMNKVLEQHGYPLLTLEDTRLFVGDGLKKVVERSIPEKERTPERIETLYLELRQIYNTGYSHQLMLYPGISQTLDALVSRGIKIAINTNKNQDISEKIVQELLSRWPFQKIVGSSRSLPKKPNPQGLLSILEELKISPLETLYVGDTSIDLETAQNAGVSCINVLYGFRTKEELLPYGPKFMIEHPMDLVSLLETTFSDVD